MTKYQKKQTLLLISGELLPHYNVMRGCGGKSHFNLIKTLNCYIYCLPNRGFNIFALSLKQELLETIQ